MKYILLVQVAVQPMKRRGNGALGARCDYIGSPTNLVSSSLTWYPRVT